jgi:hypothetical protein
LSGNNGTIQWQSSTNNSVFTNIDLATSSTLTLTNLTATTYYKAVSTSGVCPAATTSSATITVLPPTIPVVIVDALCQGNGTINLTSNPLGTNPVFAGTGVTGSVFNATGLATGVYPITFTSTDANGCPMSGNGSITITSPPSTPVIYTD